MKIEAVGSFLPNEILIDARKKHSMGLVDNIYLADIEDNAVKDIVDRQIASGLDYITSGELRRNHWAMDFWHGLNGISHENTSSGDLYHPVEVNLDRLQLTGRIAYNPEHPFFKDFAFLHQYIAGRAKSRQSMPSPADLLLEVLSLSDAYNGRMYSSLESLVEDIAEAYRLTILHLYELGCDSVLFDDTACGLMCDDHFTKRLIQGGADIMKIHQLIIDVINLSVKDLPADMETAIYLSGGDTIVPEWEYIKHPENIMPSVLENLNVDKFFLPFNIENDYSLEILRHVPKGKKVVLGLMDAHSPFSENISELSSTIRKAMRHVDPDSLFISPKTGFKLSSYSSRGLTVEDQWRKLSELNIVP